MSVAIENNQSITVRYLWYRREDWIGEHLTRSLITLPLSTLLSSFETKTWLISALKVAECSHPLYLVFQKTVAPPFGLALLAND